MKGENKMDEKYDKNNNLVYKKNSNGLGKWQEYDDKNNLIHFKNSAGYEDWQEYDENNREIHFKDNSGHEYWYEYNKNNKKIDITKQEYKEIKFKTKEKEYLSRTKVSRFELIDI